MTQEVLGVTAVDAGDADPHLSLPPLGSLASPAPIVIGGPRIAA
jgi:hypothetical protein